MDHSDRYLRERDEFVSRASRLVPWIDARSLAFLAYYADTEEFSELNDRRATCIFDETKYLRLPELKKLGTLHFFKPEPPWIERRIPKRSGSGDRVLYLPNTVLKQLHRFILRAHLKRLCPDRAAYGFEPGRGRRQHAENHCNQHVVVRVDIRNFFPSIEVDRIVPIFRECGFESAFADLLAHLVTFHNRVPQGAPTSPKLADLVARPLDRKLRSLAKEKRWYYSRYADDLCLSCPRDISGAAIGQMIDLVEDEVEEQGFRLNHGKTRVMKDHRRQQVVGVVVNNPKPRVPREKRRLVDSILYNCEETDLLTQARRYRRKVQKEQGQFEVVKGRHGEETKRSDRGWPYQKQAEFIPRAIRDALSAYPEEDWTAVYDFWHYLSGSIGEITAIEPGVGRRFQERLQSLTVLNAKLPDAPSLSASERTVDSFWRQTWRLVGEINTNARHWAQTREFIDFPAMDPSETKLVALDQPTYEAFARLIYRQLYEGLGSRAKYVRDLWEKGELQALQHAVDVCREYHTPEESKRERERLERMNKGFDRLVGKEWPETSEEWHEAQTTHCEALLEDLRFLKDWAQEGLD